MPCAAEKGTLSETHYIRNVAGWEWAWPSTIQQELAFQPRNPDIVAYHPRTPGQWRFCEVKGPGDRCSGEHFREELRALGVLHLLTEAPVAVVRLVPAGQHQRPPRVFEAHLPYKPDASLEWICAPTARRE